MIVERLLEHKKILVMGLIDTRSLAFEIGSRAQEEGADVIYTVQNERFRDVLLRRSLRKEGLRLEDFSILPCDVTSDEDIAKLFKVIEHPLDGLVYSIAYANPKTCLQETLLGAPRADILEALNISAVSFVKVAEVAKERFTRGGSMVAMTFDAGHTYPNYSWMGVAKATLESEVRYLAAALGRSGIRVNSLSAGPQHTLAATNIPGFHRIGEVWPERSPLGWDLDKDRRAVAGSAVYLLSHLSEKVTGTVHFVDGGFNSVAI